MIKLVKGEQCICEFSSLLGCQRPKGLQDCGDGQVYVDIDEEEYEKHVTLLKKENNYDLD